MFWYFYWKTAEKIENAHSFVTVNVLCCCDEAIYALLNSSAKRIIALWENYSLSDFTPRLNDTFVISAIVLTSSSFLCKIDLREGSRSSISPRLYHCKAPCEMTACITDSRLKLGDKGYLEEPLTDCAIYNRAIQQAEKSKQYTNLLTSHIL